MVVRPRLILTALPAVLLCCLAVAPAPVAATTHRAPHGRAAIGDSVMKAAKPRLTARAYAVNAAVSRQVSGGVKLLRSKKQEGALRTQVVVHLGTNGTFRWSQCRSMHRIVGPRRNLFLVTVKVPRPWERANNRVIARCSKKYANTFMIDWRRYARHHDALLAGDGYHLTLKGARRYAALVDRTVDRLGRR
jgi:hypothetical protein